MYPKSSFNEKKILITVKSINNFSGSELVAFNLARYFMKAGAEVTIGAFQIGQPLLEMAIKEGIKVNDVNYELKEKKYDLIWAHHGYILTTCLFDWKVIADKIIFSSLGPTDELEVPPIYVNDLSLCLCNSLETRDSCIKAKANNDLLYVFPNSVEDNCLKMCKVIRNYEVKKIAIVSNHICEELKDATYLLRNFGITVDIFGLGYNVKYVSPQLIEQYDAIVTIGRTVQYALVLGVPVYCYDIFGGPGWITVKNLLNEEYYNFSGRGTPVLKNHMSIANEIVLGYGHIINEVNSLSLYARKKFVLGNNIKEVFDVLKTKPNIDWIKFHKKYDDMKKNAVI